MKTRSVLLFLVAVGLGLVATIAVSRYMESQKAIASTEPKPEEIKLVAAAQDIPAATLLEKHMLTMVSLPSKAVPRGACTDLDKLVGRTTRYTLLAGDPIVENKLAPPGSLTGLAAMIPEGMRAISVKVNAYSGVAGFVQPGARVDVLLTICGKQGAGTTMTKTILQNVKVLAIDQNMETDEERKSKLVDTITLLVTPVQAEIVSLAANQGKLQLVLRSNVDQSSATTAGMTLTNLMLAAGCPAPESVVHEPSEPPQAEARADYTDSAGLRAMQESDGQKKLDDRDKTDEEKRPIKYIVQVIRGTEVSEKAFDLPEEDNP